MFPAYSQNNAKKKKKKKCLLEGNKNIDSTKHFIGTKDANPLIFKTNKTEQMRITSGGYIGIGVCIPKAKLHINNIENSPYSLLVYNGSNPNFVITHDSRVGIGTDAPAASLEIINNTGIAALNIGNSYDSYFYINSTGKVEIGTTNIPAGFTMAVCGKIKSQEILVEPPGWCDYVFDPDYELMSWDSLMLYIREHKHLPGVPSEKEVENRGVPVGEMNKILLQKIEELVLYNNELREAVKELRKEVSELKKTNQFTTREIKN